MVQLCSSATLEWRSVEHAVILAEVKVTAPAHGTVLAAALPAKPRDFVQDSTARTVD